jgi:putative lipoprotein
MSQLCGVIQVHVTYPQRVALRPGAKIEVLLQDFSHMDAPARTISSESRITAGEQVPFEFELPYDPESIDPRMTYAVTATIQERNKLWRSSNAYLVLTRRSPTDFVEVVVQPIA